MIKKIMLMFTVCLLLTTSVFASEASQITTVQVAGSSQKEIAPDIAKISLSITTIHNNLEQAKNDNTKSANQVFAKLKEQGVRDHQIKTDEIVSDKY